MYLRTDAILRQTEEIAPDLAEALYEFIPYAYAIFEEAEAAAKAYDLEAAEALYDAARDILSRTRSLAISRGFRIS